MDNTPKTPDTPKDEVHILDYLILLAKHSRMIIFTTLAVMILTYLVLFIIPNKYTSTARILPPQQNMTMTGHLLEMVGGGINPVGGGGGLGALAGGLFGLRSPAESYVTILSSDTIANKLIDKFQLKELYKQKYLEDTKKFLRKHVEIKAGKKDGIIAITVIDKSAERAAEMGNAFIQELDSLLQSLAVQETIGRLAFLEKELTQANAKLSNAEEALRRFSEKNSVIQIDTQTRGMLQYIAQLRAEIDANEVQIQVLRQQATPYNHDVIRLETQVKGLKEKLRAAEKEWDQSCIGDVCLTTSKVPTLGLEYLRLYRDFKYQETLYQLYTKMVEIARLDMVRDVAVVQVVDKALPPDKKSNKRLIPTLIVGIATFFTMALVPFAKEWTKKFLHDEKSNHDLQCLWDHLQPYRKLIGNKEKPSRKKDIL